MQKMLFACLVLILLIASVNADRYYGDYDPRKPLDAIPIDSDSNRYIADYDPRTQDYNQYVTIDPELQQSVYCVDCLNQTQIEDIYLFNDGDTGDGNYTLNEDLNVLKSITASYFCVGSDCRSSWATISGDDTNWETANMDFKELAQLWAYFPYKTVGDANISDVAWGKITGAPHFTSELTIDANIYDILANSVPWADANISSSATWNAKANQDTNAETQCNPNQVLRGDGNCVIYTPSTTFYATSITTVSGTDTNNNVLGAITAYDSNSYTVQEDSGANPLQVDINFTGVTGLDSILMRERYIGGQGHEILVEVYDYNSSTWEEYAEITDQAGMVVFDIPVFDSNDHISGGLVQLRFRHVNNGITAHSLLIDFVWLQEGATTLVNAEHDSLSGRDSTTNHPWALPYTGASQDTNTGDYNVAAKYFIGDGSLLTGLTDLDTNWETAGLHIPTGITIDGNIEDILANSVPWTDANVSNQLTVDWAGITNYPGACSAGQFVTQVDDNLTCAAPSYTTDTNWQTGGLHIPTDATIDGNIYDTVSGLMPLNDANVADTITATNYVTNTIFNAFYPVAYDANITNRPSFGNCDENTSCVLTTAVSNTIFNAFYPIADANIASAATWNAKADSDTNAETACNAGEVLYGDGSCAAPAGSPGGICDNNTNCTITGTMNTVLDANFLDVNISGELYGQPAFDETVGSTYYDQNLIIGSTHSLLDVNTTLCWDGVDLAALISASKADSDCNNVEVLYQGAEIDRDIINCNSATAMICIKVQSQISANTGNTVDYKLQYNKSDGADSILDNNSNVYFSYDDFSSDTTGNYTEGFDSDGQCSQAISSGTLKITLGAGGQKCWYWLNKSQGMDKNFQLRARMRANDDGADYTSPNLGFGAFSGIASEGYTIYGGTGAGQTIATRGQINDVIVGDSTNGLDSNLSASIVANTFYVFDLNHAETGNIVSGKIWSDFPNLEPTWTGTKASSNVGGNQVFGFGGIPSDVQGKIVEVDWWKAMRLLTVEPALSLGSEQSHAEAGETIKRHIVQVQGSLSVTDFFELDSNSTAVCYTGVGDGRIWVDSGDGELYYCDNGVAEKIST